MAPKQPITRSKPYSILISLVVAALLLASCSVPSILSNAPTPVPASPTPMPGLGTPAPISPSPTPQVLLSTPTSVPASPTPLLPLATPTDVLLAPTTAPLLLLSPTAAPTDSLPLGGTFSLITGTTAGVLQGTLQPGQVATYTLSAGQAQPLTLIMNSPNNDVTMGVFEPNGNVLLDPAAKYTRWQMALPATELYTIQVMGGATTESFTLTIKLPLVVSFGSGTNSSTLNGTTVNGYLFSYSFNCAIGQTMSASLNVPSSTAYIDIYGLSSGTLLSASEQVNSWTGVLPQTQDYIVEVVPVNNLVVNYSLTVSCTGTPGSSYAPPASTSSSSTGGQLYIAPGQTEAVVQGNITPGQVVTYSVQANQFQPMILIVGSPNNDVVLGVLDPNGNTMLNPTSEFTYWQWMLPQTGLYTIHVVGGITSEKYTLTTKIGRLYTYPASGTSMTIYATTLKGYIKSYAFRLSAGVVMTLTLNVPSTTAYLDVFGLETGSILNASERATTWTGTMPSQQEYVVEVIPGGTESAYTLTISNP